jgi:hypothetical protein
MAKSLTMTVLYKGQPITLVGADGADLDKSLRSVQAMEGASQPAAPTKEATVALSKGPGPVRAVVRTAQGKKKRVKRTVKKSAANSKWPSAASFIRTVPKLPVKEVLVAARKEGIETTEANVRVVRYEDKQKALKAKAKTRRAA